MKYVIRADASARMGSGHIMRCLSLADELRRRGESVQIFSRSLDGNLTDYVRRHRNFESVEVPEGDEIFDADFLLSEIRDHKNTFVILDNYLLGKGWESRIRESSLPLLVIDDLEREHDCDFLLDQNFQPPGRYTGKVPPQCKLLTGPKYALLRSVFAHAHRKASPRKKLRRIVAGFGGRDLHGDSYKVLEAWERLDTPVELIFMTGRDEELRDELDRRIGKYNRVNALPFVEDVPEFFLSADLAIGAGGISTLERIATGLPSLVILTADNQRKVSRMAEEQGVITVLGESSEVGVDDIEAALRHFVSHPEVLEELSSKCLCHVDGRGTARTAALIQPDLQLRPAKNEDARLIYEWRNHPQNRRYSLNPNPIGYAEHEAWYLASMTNPDRLIFLADREDGEPAGVFRLDFSDRGQSATVSIFLAPGTTGRGLGRRVLHAGLRLAKKQFPSLSELHAEIREENAPSLSLFQSMGFEWNENKSVWIFKTENLDS